MRPISTEPSAQLKPILTSSLGELRPPVAQMLFGKADRGYSTLISRPEPVVPAGQHQRELSGILPCRNIGHRGNTPIRCNREPDPTLPGLDHFRRAGNTRSWDFTGDRPAGLSGERPHQGEDRAVDGEPQPGRRPVVADRWAGTQHWTGPRCWTRSSGGGRSWTRLGGCHGRGSTGYVGGGTCRCGRRRCDGCCTSPPVAPRPCSR